MTVYSSANYAFQAPNGDDLITNGDDLLRTLVDKLDLVIGGTPAVTTLPVAPVNGQHCCFLADATVMWHLVWRSASRAGSGAWHYIGGPPLYARVDTDESTASTVFTALATALSISTPAGVTGDYDICCEAGMYTAAAGVVSDLLASYAVGATAATDTDATWGTGYADNHIPGASARWTRKTSVAAATAIAARYRIVAVGTGHWQFRSLRIQPVQVW